MMFGENKIQKKTKNQGAESTCSWKKVWAVKMLSTEIKTQAETFKHRFKLKTEE